MYEIDRNMQKENLDVLIKNNGFKFTDTFFPYTSGKIGPYYINSESVMNDFSSQEIALKSMKKLVSKYSGKDSIISGGELRDLIFSLPVADRIGRERIVIRKTKKIIGPNIKDKYVTHVADLNNEGSSAKDFWIPAIREAGETIEDIFFYVDRMELGYEMIKELGLKSYSVVPLDEFAWNYLKEKEILNEEIYNSINNRNKNPEEWAKEILKSEKGFKKLKEIILNPLSKERGLKILNKGYPHLKVDLREKLIENGLNFLKIF